MNNMMMIAASAATAMGMTLHAAAGESCEPFWDVAMGNPGFDDMVHAIATFDDGTGETIYVGGEFETAGGVEVNGIARWNGEQWEDVGGGLAGDPGFLLDGPAVFSFAVHDDGTGEALYVGGAFEEAGGVPANNIARWDGENWSAVGEGVSEGFPHVAVEALLSHDDGDGPILYLGGNFEIAGGEEIIRLATWDGETYSDVGGSDFSNFVMDLAFFDDGNGEQLYAVGAFFSVGDLDSRFIARYDGEQWSEVGEGVSGGQAHQLQVYNDTLYVSGLFNEAGDELPANRIAAWDGEWSTLGGGVGPTFQSDVRSLHVFDDGEGELLYAGGLFDSAGSLGGLSGLAAWDGEQWLAPIPHGADDRIRALHTASGEQSGEQGDALLIGGEFETAGGEPADRFALWQGCATDAAIPGDLTGDGAVGGADLGILLSEWGECADPDDCPADLNGDGTVGGADLGILLSNWTS